MFSFGLEDELGGPLAPVDEFNSILQYIADQSALSDVADDDEDMDRAEEPLAMPVLNVGDQLPLLPALPPLPTSPLALLRAPEATSHSADVAIQVPQGLGEAFRQLDAKTEEKALSQRSLSVSSHADINDRLRKEQTELKDAYAKIGMDAWYNERKKTIDKEQFFNKSERMSARRAKFEKELEKKQIKQTRLRNETADRAETPSIGLYTKSERLNKIKKWRARRAKNGSSYQLPVRKEFATGRMRKNGKFITKDEQEALRANPDLLAQQKGVTLPDQFYQPKTGKKTEKTLVAEVQTPVVSPSR